MSGDGFNRRLYDLLREVYGHTLAPVFSRLVYAIKRLLNKPYFGWYLSARQGTPDRLQLMGWLARAESKKMKEGCFRLLEIGSWAGGSALTWGRALRDTRESFEVLCVDAWRPSFDLARNRDIHYRKMDGAKHRDRIFRLFVHNVSAAGLAGHVLPLRGTSKERLAQLQPGIFDLVYIDGDHSYGGVQHDLQASARILRVGGVLCGDDLEAQVPGLDLEHLKRHLDQDYVLDPVRDLHYHPGLSLAVWEFFGEEVSERLGFWAMRKTAAGWEKIDLTPG